MKGLGDQLGMTQGKVMEMLNGLTSQQLLTLSNASLGRGSVGASPENRFIDDVAKVVDIASSIGKAAATGA